MAEPSVSSTGSPYMDDSSKVSQSSVELQQPIVFEFPNGGPVLAKKPFGGPVEFNWPFSDPLSELRLGADFLSLTSSSPFIAAVFPPSPHRLLRDLAAGSNMSESSEEIPMSGEYYQLFPRRLFPGDNPEPAVMSPSGPSLPADETEGSATVTIMTREKYQTNTRVEKESRHKIKQPTSKI